MKMVEQERIIEWFALLVCEYQKKEENPERIDVIEDWDSFVNHWLDKLVSDGIICLKNDNNLRVDILMERRGKDIFKQIINQVNEGKRTIEIIFNILEKSKSNIFLCKTVAESFAKKLYKLDNFSKKNILCCGIGSLTIALNLILMDKRVDLYVLEKIAGNISMLLFLLLMEQIKPGGITIKELDIKNGDYSKGIFFEGAADFPKGYALGVYLMPFMMGPMFDRDSVSKLADVSIILHHPEILWTRKQSYQNFREEIVDRRGLESVILLPNGCVYSVLIQAAVLILKKTKVFEEVGFVDFSNEKSTRRSYSWSFPFKKISDIAVFVSVESLSYSGYLLDVKRQVTSSIPELQLMMSGEHAKLNEIASIIRAQSISDKKSSEQHMMLLEVLASDIDEIGIVNNPKKIIHVGADGEARAKKAWLKKGDILIAIKGSVGKVGFINDELAGILENTELGKKWVAGQSFVIIRIKIDYIDKITPEYLFRYLRSYQTRKYFESRSIGVAIPLIKMVDIESLPIRLPAQDTIKRETQLHNKQIAIRNEIMRLKKELVKYELDLNEL